MGIQGEGCQPLMGAAVTTFSCLEGLMDLALGVPFTWPDLGAEAGPRACSSQNSDHSHPGSQHSQPQARLESGLP